MTPNQSGQQAFTRGPWEYVGGNDFCVEINLPNDNIISIDRGQRYSDKYVMSRAELEANARLIAEAPTMAALLRKIMDDSISGIEARMEAEQILSRITPKTLNNG